MKRKNIIFCTLIMTLFLLLSGCNQVANTSITESHAETTARVKPTPTPPKVFSPELLPEERESITLGKLSPDHLYYDDVTWFDPECADYIQELSIYDAEIDDNFIVHISMPPDFEENKDYPMVVITDGIWRLSDHPELRPMMVSGEIQPVILVSVGYPNGYDYENIRVRDLVNDPESFLHFIADNLVPYLSEIFPVDSRAMTLAGHSYGGYWTLYAMFNGDTIGRNLFENYYVGSPALLTSTGTIQIDDYAAAYYERNSSANCNVYVCVGESEPEPFKAPITSFISEMNSRNDSSLVLFYEIIEGYDHNTVFKPSIRSALLMFYGIEDA